MPRVAVATVDEIPPGERKLVVPFCGKAGIGVFNVNGAFHAVRNICPHKLGPICTGQVSGRAVADAPVSTNSHGLSYERDGEILRCPWHQWEFEISTGQCLVDPTKRVKTYAVSVEGDQVLVEYDE